jgi:hypothetical protein
VPYQLIQRFQIPQRKNRRQQWRILSRIVRIEHSTNGRAPDPLCRTFVGNRQSPSTRTRCASLSIAAISERTRAGIGDHAGAAGECSF